MKPFSPDSKLGRKIMGIIQHYNHDKYWKRRNILINPQNKAGFLTKLYYLYYIKKQMHIIIAHLVQILIMEHILNLRQYYRMGLMVL